MFTLEVAKWLGIASVPLFAYIALCYGMNGMWGNMVVNLGITILYFGLFVMMVALKIQ
jgi:hypothetical protein